MALEDHVPQIMKAGIKNLKNLRNLKPSYFLPDLIINDLNALDVCFFEGKRD